VAFNRTAEKLRPLEKAGARITDSSASVIAESDCTILMLTNALAIEELVLGSQCRDKLKGKTLIQMGTIGPQESRSLAEAISRAGGEYLEAPVLGSIPEAKAGQLLLMVGSTPAQFEKWGEVLKNFGPEPVHIGPVGSAAALKLALNQLIASLTAAFALSLGFVRSGGVEVEAFMKILRQSALYAPTFDKKLQRMLEGNYENPNFPTKHLLKDTKLFLQEAEALKLDVSSLAGVGKILEKAVALNLGELDYSALFDAVEQTAEIETNSED
jgi:3-hydroxyisobutyrate dehydrogenase